MEHTSDVRKIDLTEFFLRYLFVIAATWDTKEGAIAKKWLMRPNFHLHLLFMGMIVIFLHGFSTLFQADDQFFFDQGKIMMRRFHEKFGQP